MLKRLSYIPKSEEHKNYPFNLKWLYSIDELNFENPITFLVGENGIDKFTLIESLAIQSQIPQLTNKPYETDPDYSELLSFSNCLRSEWSIKSRRGFFFRANDFISFLRENNQLRKELLNELELLNDRGVPKLAFERQPYENSLATLKKTYPTELDKLSHGQAFLELFKNRLTSNGLYLLDEPEIPFSSQNQLALLHMIDQQIKKGSQFIIASHSPILMAHPEAVIYKIDEYKIKPISYDEVENVSFMKNFMSDPQRFMYYTLNNR